MKNTGSLKTLYRNQLLSTKGGSSPHRFGGGEIPFLLDSSVDLAISYSGHGIGDVNG
jgi:hypothetical protein